MEAKPVKKTPLKTTEYKLVTGGTITKFNSEVSFLLGEGWVLYGSPTMTGTTGLQIIFGQALIKEVEVTEQ